MSVSRPFVYASVLAGLLGPSGIAGAEELGPEQARAFIVGKLFAFTCFEGTTGWAASFPTARWSAPSEYAARGSPHFGT
jgi:hypothetical protein